MKVYAGDRRSGKTTKLANWVLEDRDNRAVIVANRDQARYYEGLGLTSREVIPYVNLDTYTVGSTRTYAIDDAEFLLERIFRPNVKIEVIAMTANTILKREEKTQVVFSEEDTYWANYHG